MELLDIRRKDLSNLEELKKDLEQREAIMTKKEAIIRESNRRLDIRRAKITAREQQLQIDAEIE